MAITVSIYLLSEDIKGVMKKHGVPEEFYALQLTRVLEMLSLESATDEN